MENLNVLFTAPSGGGKTVLLSSFSKVLSMNNWDVNGFCIAGSAINDLSKVYFNMVQQCHWPAPTEIGEFSKYEFQMYPYDSVREVPALFSFNYFDFPGEITTKTRNEIRSDAELRCFDAYENVQATCDVHVVALDGLKLTALMKGGLKTKDNRECRAFNEDTLNQAKAAMALQLHIALNHSIRKGDLMMPDSKPLLIAITKWDIAKASGITLENVKTFLLSEELGICGDFMRTRRDIVLIPVSVTGDGKTFMNITETGVVIDIISREFVPYNVDILFNLIFYSATKAILEDIVGRFKIDVNKSREKIEARKREISDKLEEIEDRPGFLGFFGRVRQRVISAYEKTINGGRTDIDILDELLTKMKEDSYIEEELDKEGEIPYLRNILLKMKDARDRNPNSYIYIKRK